MDEKSPVLLPLAFSRAEDWNLVRLPAAKDVRELSAVGFLLFHRACDYWIGGLAEGVVLPQGE